MGETQSERLVLLLSEELRKMATRLTQKPIAPAFRILVVGLGNRDLTADAIGPRTVDGLTATRHLQEQEPALYRALGCASLSALAPGVLGQTGIEVLELLRGAVRAIRPDAVLAIDALAARSCDRLASTVQLTDTGICPGSGLGAGSFALNGKTVGVPVMALGVPTVVESATLIGDALSRFGLDPQSPEFVDLVENGVGFFVTPKEIDVLVPRIASLLAGAIEKAFSVL